jgi:hypothetical protein
LYYTVKLHIFLNTEKHNGDASLEERLLFGKLLELGYACHVLALISAMTSAEPIVMQLLAT